MRTLIFRGLVFCSLIYCSVAKSQTNGSTGQTKMILFEGIIVAGYADKGGYINCTGPSVKFSKKPFVVLLGFLPSLRIKRDKVVGAAPKNSLVTPSLGIGITAGYKHLVVQIPVFYNAKTSNKDGKWNHGIGIGYKF